ncbi:sensor histidine kinase [Streptomyces sp. NPDC086010]|uniref:sensor histidine kinase n=1 Tax=Streptomyces sp. NPDC086010 TaxID=3365745 RepID=UPI0037D512F5
MTTSPAGPPPPSTPSADGPPSAVRRSLRELAHGLSHASRPPVPPFADSPSRWLRLLPYAVVAALAAVFVPVTIQVLANDYHVGGGVAGALAVGQTAPLLMLAHRPLQAWWIVFTADTVGAVVLLGQPPDPGVIWPWPPPTLIAYLFVLLALGLRERRTTVIGVWLVTALAGLALHLAAPARSDGGALLLLVLGAVVLVIGAAVRERSEVQRRLVEQETISEAERAQRTLLEERTRIARELHDVVAHHMSVITVQADSAPYRVAGLSDEARAEFASIAAGARESLAEMRRLLSVLRSDGSRGELAPQPGLGRVQQLVEATVRAGLPAELSLAAGVREAVERGEVPQAVDLSAYRIVQEGLANVVRHAPGAPTRVSVSVRDGHLTVLVVNGSARGPGSPLEVSGTGHGLVGMRERVRLTGGSLDTGPLPDGGFRVAARLPLPPSRPPSAVETPEDL